MHHHYLLFIVKVTSPSASSTHNFDFPIMMPVPQIVLPSLSCFFFLKHTGKDEKLRWAYLYNTLAVF